MTKHDQKINDAYNKVVAERDLRSWFDRLKKFKMLGTGVPSIDKQVRELCGEWLQPSERRCALQLEINRILATGGDESPIPAHQEQLIALQGKKDNDGKFPAYWECTNKKIPFPIKDKNGKETGEIGFMKLRQIHVTTIPVTDSGRMRITFVSRTKSYHMVDIVTGKKIREYDLKGLEQWLGFWFPVSEVNHIFMEVLG